MKILQIIPSLVSGGAEQAVVDINAALLRTGAGSFVASSGGARAAEITAAGGMHVTLPLATKNPALILANAYRLADIITAHGIDIVHARSRAPAWSGYGATRLTRRHFVTTFHAAYAAGNTAKKYYNGVMARGACVIAISDFIAAHIRTHYPQAASRVVTIPRGIDLAVFNPAAVAPERRAALRAQWGVADATPLLLMPARISRIKGHAVLIEALRHLRAAHPAVSFHAVIIGAAQGRDDYVRELRGMIAASGLTAHVTLAESCRDMAAAYATAALVVAPSLVAEGFGRVPVEAQAMGAPVIASALGGFQETIIPDVTGWLVPPGDTAALTQKIVQVLTLNPGARSELACRAQDHVRTRFSLEKMTADTLDVYRRVLAT
ncbi:MAG: glycosyltransferase family 4 protein [Alphaproteobacteria bacterium]